MPAFKKKGGFKSGGFKAGAVKLRTSSGRQRSGEAHDARLELFYATCAQCRTKCEVPFRPNGQKPVFCRDCFGQKKGARRGASPTTYERTAPVAGATIDELKRQMDAMNKKIDSIARMVENLG